MSMKRPGRLVALDDAHGLYTMCANSHRWARIYPDFALPRSHVRDDVLVQQRPATSRTTARTASAFRTRRAPPADSVLSHATLNTLPPTSTNTRVAVTVGMRHAF
ncbi:hypothetical protein F6X37_10510 [Paraburkholderia sp. 31.1]|nr:hypothetical protein [Paraburkholderia sp. 31.1]